MTAVCRTGPSRARMVAAQSFSTPSWLRSDDSILRLDHVHESIMCASPYGSRGSRTFNSSVNGIHGVSGVRCCGWPKAPTTTSCLSIFATLPVRFDFSSVMDPDEPTVLHQT